VKRRAAGLALALALLARVDLAAAQVRWDAEIQEGAQQRIQTSTTPGGGPIGVGPMLEASGHVALAPLVRVGLYVQYESSPVSGQGARDLVSGGLDVRLFSPWPRGRVRTYARVGIGESGTFSSAYSMNAGAVGSRATFVGGASGAFTEVPVALGVMYRLTPPVWITAEAGLRAGFGFTGGAYDATAVEHATVRPAGGDDSMAVLFGVGVMWGR
jgi:hypothetical protein